MESYILSILCGISALDELILTHVKSFRQLLFPSFFIFTWKFDELYFGSDKSFSSTVSILHIVF